MAKFIITTDSKTIAKQHKALSNMRGAFDAAAHIQALCSVLYAVEHGQTSPMNQLVDIMGHAKGAMNKWAVECGPFRWVGKTKDKPAHLALNDEARKAMAQDYAKDKDAFIKALSELPTFAELTPPKNEFPGLDILKVVKREIAKAERYIANPDKYDLSKVNADGLPALKAWANEMELRREANLH
jgi:hypothetical protein